MTSEQHLEAMSKLFKNFFLEKKMNLIYLYINSGVTVNRFNANNEDNRLYFNYSLDKTISIGDIQNIQKEIYAILYNYMVINSITQDLFITHDFF